MLSDQKSYTLNNSNAIKKSHTRSNHQTKNKKHIHKVSDVQKVNSIGFGKSIIKSLTYQGNQKKIGITSLKSLISKLVHNQMSKKSLQGNLNPNTRCMKQSSKLKHQKKKSSHNNLNKSLKNTNQNISTSRQNKQKTFYEKLISLKSINASLVEYQQKQHEELSQNSCCLNQNINIKTENSIELINEIHQIERTWRKKTKEDNNFFQQCQQIQKTMDTNRIIEAYIAYLNEDNQIQENVANNNTLENQFLNNIFNNSQINSQSQQRSNINNTEQNGTSYEDYIINTQLQSQKQYDVNNNINRQIQSLQARRQDIKPFLSSQMQKHQSIINEIQRFKLNELKKQQIQKWAFLLSYIKDNVNKQTNTEEILNSVYNFLDQSKNDLQKNIIGHFKKDSRGNTTQKNDLNSFTIKLSSKQVSNGQSEQANFIELQKSKIQLQQVLSFKQQYSEDNSEQWKIINMNTIQKALRNRYNSLLQRKNRQIQHLQMKFNSGKITQIQFQNEKKKIQKLIKKETNQVTKAKNNIWKGINSAQNIIQKNDRSNDLFELSSNKQKYMMHCLSDNYILKGFKKIKKLNYQEQQSYQDGQSLQEQDTKQLNQNIKSYKQDDSEREMDLIKKRLINMKKQHFQGDRECQQYDQQEDIHYQENQHSHSFEGLKNQKLLIDSDQEQQYHNLFKKQQNNNLMSQQKVTLFKEIPNSLINHNQSQSQMNKLKYLVEQDKEDIFEFIFLDICIQLYQQPCKDNKFMVMIAKYINKMKNMAKKRKGIKTTLTVVKQYLKRFMSYIIRTNRNVLNGLNNPMGPTAIQMLRYMHQFDDDRQQQQQQATYLVIPIQLFDHFDKNLLLSLQFETYYDDQQRQKNRIQFLKNVLHIHNKAIFDALNQFLDMKKPFGIWGKPFPWKHIPLFQHTLTQQQQQIVLKQGCEKIGQYCSYVCGLLVDKEDSLVGNAKISEDYIQTLKEDRLSRMLANDLIQNEQRWLFFDDEQTQVLVQLSNFVWDALIKQLNEDIR